MEFLFIFARFNPTGTNKKFPLVPLMIKWYQMEICCSDSFWPGCKTIFFRDAIRPDYYYQSHTRFVLEEMRLKEEKKIPQLTFEVESTWTHSTPTLCMCCGHPRVFEANSEWTPLDFCCCFQNTSLVKTHSLPWPVDISTFMTQ